MKLTPSHNLSPCPLIEDRLLFCHSLVYEGVWQSHRIDSRISMKLQGLLAFVATTVIFAGCGGDKNEAGSGGPIAKGDPVLGKALYVQNCTSCHGEGGKGDGPAAANINPKPADHTSKAVIGKRSDEELANIIKMGGGIIGKPSMPPSPQLSDKQRSDLVAYLRQLSSTEHQ